MYFVLSENKKIIIRINHDPYTVAGLLFLYLFIKSGYHAV